mgnify:CR=1 FL=1
MLKFISADYIRWWIEVTHLAPGRLLDAARGGAPLSLAPSSSLGGVRHRSAICHSGASLAVGHAFAIMLNKSASPIHSEALSKTAWVTGYEAGYSSD